MDSLSLPLKIGVISTAALAATFLCFLLMNFLIMTELGNRDVIEPVRLNVALALDELTEDIEEPTREKPQKSIPMEPPPAPDGVPVERTEFDAVATAERPSFDLLADELMDEIRMQLAPPSAELAPLYVVQPVYPFSAVMKEIEGYVVVNFGVRANGTVQNPVIVESSPGSLFDDAALSAIDKFRFQPRTHLGDPLSVNDIQMRFVFELNGSGAAARVMPESDI